MRISCWIVSLGVVGAISAPAKADWYFPADYGYLRSVDTPNWFQVYYTDVDHFDGRPTFDTAQVWQVGVGDYWTSLPGVASFGYGGTVQVTALGGGAQYCKVWFWQLSGYDIDVRVHCYDEFGNAANSLFDLSYVRRTNDFYPVGPEAAYVLANDPTNPSYDATNTGFAWNSTGQPVTITHSLTGQYRVTMAGQTGGVIWGYPSIGDCNPDKGGTVEVTAVGDGNTFCVVAGLPKNQAVNPPMGPDAYVDIKCFNGSTGGAADSIFTMIYSTMSPSSSQSGGYVFADRPTTSNYTPNMSYSREFIATGDGNDCPHCFPENPPSVTRVSDGLYNVLFPFLSNTPVVAHNNVIVTSFNTTSVQCKVNDWWGTGSMTTVQVACHGAGGILIDSRFFVNVASGQMNQS